jgi:hypothetical protein
MTRTWIAAALLTSLVGIAPVGAEGAEPAPAAAAQSRRPAKIPYRVVKLMAEKDQAIVYDRASGEHLLVQLGDDLGAFQVVDVDDEELVLWQDGREIVLTVDPSAPAPVAMLVHRPPQAAHHADSDADSDADADDGDAGSLTATAPDVVSDTSSPAPTVVSATASALPTELAPTATPAPHVVSATAASAPMVSDTAASGPGVVSATAASAPMVSDTAGLPPGAVSGTATPLMDPYGVAAPAVVSAPPVVVAASGGASAPATLDPYAGATVVSAAPASATPAVVSAATISAPTLASNDGVPAAKEPGAPRVVLAPPDQRASLAAAAVVDPYAEPGSAASTATTSASASASASSSTSTSTSASASASAEPAARTAAGAPAGPVEAVGAPAAAAARAVELRTTVLPLERAQLAAAVASFDKLAKDHGFERTPRGIRLNRVAPDSYAYGLGLRSGDLITAIDGAPLRGLDDAAAAYVGLDTATQLSFDVERGAAHGTLRFSLR